MTRANEELFASELRAALPRDILSVCETVELASAWKDLG